MKATTLRLDETREFDQQQRQKLVEVTERSRLLEAQIQVRLPCACLLPPAPAQPRRWGLRCRTADSADAVVPAAPATRRRSHLSLAGVSPHAVAISPRDQTAACRTGRTHAHTTDSTS